MKHYTLSTADAFTHVPEHPERTAKRAHGGLNFDWTFQVWSNRAAMVKTIRMQERRAPQQTDWKACVKLTPGEGL